MMSEGSRGWRCAAVLVLAALSTCLAENGTDPTSAATTKIVAPNTTQATVPTKETQVTNTTAAPTSSSASSTSSTKSTSTAPPPPPPSPTTKVPTTASTSSATTVTTTVTTKETVKSTTQSSTTATPENSTMASGSQKISGFDLGSFIGGIVLTLGILAVVYFGCRFYNSRRGVRYRTIDEHEAII